MKFYLLKQVLLNCVTKNFYKKPNVMSSEQTIEYIIKNKCSVGRLGDGEIDIVLNKDLGFQKNNNILKEKIKTLKTSEKFLLCIPYAFKMKEFKQKNVDFEYDFWRKHMLKYDYLWRKLYGKNKILGDAFISRFYLKYKDKSSVSDYIQKLKLLWQNRNVVFVEGEHSRLGVGNDLFNNAKSIKRILCPATNAFEKYDEILQTIEQKINKEDLLILALGPTATVLAYDLSKLGYQALDLGHVDIEYEWYLLGTDKKVPIPHKHVNECKSIGYENLGKLKKEYENQIVAMIL